MQVQIELERRFWFLIVVALLSLLCLWGIGDIAFVSLNEARRAVTVREMFQSHDWLLPRMNDELYLAKPPLFYWLALLPVSLFGAVSEWAVRLPSALFALASMGGAYYWGSRLGGRGMGIFASLFLAANASFSQFARGAEIEMTLTGFCFLSLLCAWVYIFHDGRRRWSILSYLLLGGGLLTKGPVCLLLVTLPVLLFSLLQRGTRARQYLCDLPGWLIALGLGVSWYLVVTLQEGLGVWQAIFKQDIIDKVSGQAPDHWYAYLLYVGGDFFPFLLILLVRPRQLWRQIKDNPQLKLLLCSVLAPLLVFSLFSDKHAKYLLPAYPLFALLLAWQWMQVLGALGGWKRRVLLWTPLVLVACFVGFFTLAQSRVFAYRVEALPAITRVAEAHAELPLYTLGVPDMRLVYYAGRPVRTLNPEALASVDKGLLFVEGKLPETLALDPRCVQPPVKRYLSKRKDLQVVLLGSACAVPPAVAN